MHHFQSFVRNDPGRLPPFSRRRRAAPRSGNTIVLVVGILVLLVIIATAYVSRTHAGRVTATSTQRATLRDSNAQVIADSIASEIAEALFVRPLGPFMGVPGQTAPVDAPRLPQIPLDTDGDNIVDWFPIRYGVDPNFPYNFAPFQLVPFTNWPDDLTGLLGQVRWPEGPGAPNGQDLHQFFDVGEGNPLGNPGFADNRWLADLEPVRMTLPGLDGVLGTADDVVVFSHWRHMTNMARRDNGWRIVGDISDIESSLVTSLQIPVEQWLSIQPANVTPVTGDSSMAAIGPDIFLGQWGTWFGLAGLPGIPPENGYLQSYTTSANLVPGIPANFYRLSDLDPGFTAPHEWFIGDVPQERPESEFIPGSARHTVLRVLADADGDGFTDSFWFLAPTMIEGGLRQVVAIRIIDNSAMLDVNAATRFVLDDISFPVGSKTRGHTPADIALVGEMNDIDPPGLTWNVGIFDNKFNWEDFFPGSVGLPLDDPASPYGTAQVRWNPQRWNSNDGRSFLTEIGVDGNPNFPASGPLNGAANRLDYWRLSGLRPFSATGGLTPFTLADELELRMYSGQNYPWVLSRFERAVNTLVTQNAFLHSTNDQFNNHIRVESSEYLDQLSNRELLFDSRRKLTMFSAARNDLMPPWLWWRWPVPAGIIPGSPEEANFLAQARRKLDLRDPDDIAPAPGERTFAQRLPTTLLLALTDGAPGPATTVHKGDSYYGEYDASDTSLDSAFGKLRRLAAGFTANIEAYRDEDSFAPLGDDPATVRIEGAVPLPSLSPFAPVEQTKMLGLEAQPFLLEAFICHVYASESLPQPPLNDPPYTPLYEFPGNYVDSSHNQSTVVVVQIANPFDREIDIDTLGRLKITVFGQELALRSLPNLRPLPPATESNPATAIFYAVDETFAHNSLGLISDFGLRWRDFLDIEFSDLAPGTMVYNASAAWSTDRVAYDPSIGPGGGLVSNSIELARVDTSLGVAHNVVIDRFDYADDHEPAERRDEFLKVVSRLARPPQQGNEVWSTVPQGSLKPGIRIEGDIWVTWARVTRPWGYDFNHDAADASTHGIQPDERAPRFVLARQRVTTGETSFLGDRHNDNTGVGPFFGDSFANSDDPDGPTSWFVKDYAVAGGTRSRKPTFFNNNPVFRSGFAQYPAFGDPIFGYGRFLYDVSYGAAYPNGAPGRGIPDKGYYEFKRPLQMLHKDADFEQVGELRNVWLFGHELRFAGASNYERTVHTFSELLIDRGLRSGGLWIGRLQAGPIIGDSQLQASDPRYLSDPLHAVPVLPAGLRVLDAFVCDDRGVNGVANQDEFRNANAFSGKATPGLININTAPVEVIRALPHMTRLVHEDGPPIDNPYVRVPEAIVHYRERYNGGGPGHLNPTGVPNGADYADRAAGLRPERGVASIGEVMLLGKNAAASPGPLDPVENWGIDFAALRPAGLGGPGVGVESARISTDVNDVFNPVTGILEPDGVAKDVEEANLLFAGMSNLITTRSDMFTVYFKVRSFRRNPVTGVWDATDPEYIVDDSRYVMLVDRSAVNRPTDKPKILYLEKLPK